MTTHTELLRKIAAHVRADVTACYFVIGWFAASASEEDLEHLLELLHELPGTSLHPELSELLRERYSAAPYDPRD